MKAIHEDDGRIGKDIKACNQSCWLNIVNEINVLKNQGINFLDFMRLKLGNGNNISFWNDNWIRDNILKNLYPRIYALENSKQVTVCAKLADIALDASFRRKPRGGIECIQFNEMLVLMQDVSLTPISDRWIWSLEGSGDFSVASTRKAIDDKRLPVVNSKTRWIKSVPIKVNVHAWKVKLDALPTRFNISRRGIVLDSILYPICNTGVESSSHLFFTCNLARQLSCKISQWWVTPFVEVNSYGEWRSWLVSLRLSSKHKLILEGVFYVMWWHLWSYRNKLLFDSKIPLKAMIFDDIVSGSFYWCSIEKTKSVKTVRETDAAKQNPRGNQRNWNNLMSQRLGNDFKMTNKACYTCGSFEHLHYVCDKKVARPAWNNSRRVNHKNFSNKMSHPHPKRSFVPQAVLTRSGKLSTASAAVNTVRPVNTANTKAVNTARPVNTAASKQTVNHPRPINNTFKRGYSQSSRPFNRYFANKNSITKTNVNTVSVKYTTARDRAVVRNKGKGANAVKASACWNNPQQKEYKEKSVIDNGCSRHMTGNKCYLDEYEDYDGSLVSFGDGKGRISSKGKIKTGTLDFEDVYFCKELKYNLFSMSQICNKKNNVLFTDIECLVLSFDFKLLDESQVLLKVPRKDNIYSVDLKSVVPTGDLTCLIVKATIDESNTWHRTLGHINFKTMNKLMKGNLVKGSPSKIFEKIILALLVRKESNTKPPISTSLSERKALVTDDFSRFSWVFFLGTKDETSGILKTFIIEIENQLDHKVKVIRSDNGTEFKNSIMNQFCEIKGIKREFSVARTPQQNGVVERKNRTLIKAVRTMLVDSKLPTTFWAEAVNTVCYVLNRVLVIKPYNKTPYELIRGRPPLIDFMKPFGCPVTILNTRDHLGKFEGKADEGYFVGYSVVSKAMRVFNKRTRIVEETLNIRFLENSPNVKGNGPDWLFDVDSLSISMNYVPVVVGNKSNGIAGTKDNNG
ncbi:putative ribonuclease H-like domain-containing protein [Tanacetum coccineum]